MTAQQAKLPFFKTGKFSHTEPKYGLMYSRLLAVQGPVCLRCSNPFNPIYLVLISKLVKLFHTDLTLVSYMPELRISKQLHLGYNVHLKSRIKHHESTVNFYNVTHAHVQIYIYICVCVHTHMHASYIYIYKGKGVLLQARCGPESSRRFRLTDFHDIRHLKVVRLSPSRTSRLYPQECSWYSFSLGAQSTPGPWYSRKEISH